MPSPLFDIVERNQKKRDDELSPDLATSPPGIDSSTVSQMGDYLKRGVGAALNTRPGRALLSGLDTLETVLGPGRRAIQGGVHALAQGKGLSDAIDAAGENVMKRGEPVTGSTLMSDIGVENPVARGVGGFILDVGMDPLLGPFGVELGGLKKLGQAARGFSQPYRTVRKVEDLAARVAARATERGLPANMAPRLGLAPFDIEQAATDTLATVTSEPRRAALKRGLGNFFLANKKIAPAEQMATLRAAEAVGDATELASTLAGQGAAGQRSALQVLGGHDPLQMLAPVIGEQGVRQANAAILGAASELPGQMVRGAGKIASAVLPSAATELASMGGNKANEMFTKAFLDSSGITGVRDMQRAALRENQAMQSRWMHENALVAAGLKRRGIAASDLPRITQLVAEPSVEQQALGGLNREVEKLAKEFEQHGRTLQGYNFNAISDTATSLQQRISDLTKRLNAPGITPARQQYVTDQLNIAQQQLSDADNWMSLARESPASVAMRQMADDLKAWSPGGKKSAIKAVMQSRLDQLQGVRKPVQDKVNAAMTAIRREPELPLDAVLTRVSAPVEHHEAADEIRALYRRMLSSEKQRDLPISGFQGRLFYTPHVVSDDFKKFGELDKHYGDTLHAGIFNEPLHGSMRPVDEAFRDLTPAEINAGMKAGKWPQYAKVSLLDPNTKQLLFTGDVLEENPLTAIQSRALRSARAHQGATYLDRLAGLETPQGAKTALLSDMIPQQSVPRETWERIQGLRVPEQAAPHIASEIARFNERAPLEDGTSWIKALNDWWRGNATLGRGPGFHVRNAVSNPINSYLVGVTDPERYFEAARRLQMATPEQLAKATFPVRALGKNLTGARILEEAARHGGVGAGGAASFEELGNFGVQPTTSFGNQTPLKPFLAADELADYATGPAASGSLDPISNVASQIPGVSSVLPWVRNRSITRRLSERAYPAIENNAKLAHFLAKLDDGASLQEAGDSVRKVLFDYGDLTEFEKYVRNAPFGLPFLTWTRKNIPLQAEALVKTPSKVARKLDAIQEFSTQMPPLSPERSYDANVKAGERFPVNAGLQDYVNKKGETEHISQVTPLSGFDPMADLSAPIMAMQKWIGPHRADKSVAKNIVESILSATGPRGVSQLGPISSTILALSGQNWDPYRNRELDPIISRAREIPALSSLVPQQMETFAGIRRPATEAYIAKTLLPQLGSLDTLNPGNIFGTKATPGIFGNTRTSRQDVPQTQRWMRWATGLSTIPVGSKEDRDRFVQNAVKMIGDIKQLMVIDKLKGDSRSLEEHKRQSREILKYLPGLRKRGGSLNLEDNQ